MVWCCVTHSVFAKVYRTETSGQGPMYMYIQDKLVTMFLNLSSGRVFISAKSSQPSQTYAM